MTTNVLINCAVIIIRDKRIVVDATSYGYSATEASEADEIISMTDIDWNIIATFADNGIVTVACVDCDVIAEWIDNRIIDLKYIIFILLSITLPQSSTKNLLRYQSARLEDWQPLAISVDVC